MEVNAVEMDGEEGDEAMEAEDTDGEEEQFDISLPAAHSYMGHGLISVRGRSVLEPGWEGKVPAIARHGTVFPGETVPLLLTHSQDISLLSHAIRTDRLFGLLCPEFELRRTLIVWNSALAAFSIMGACRTLPEFIHVLRNHGIYHSVCVPSFIEQDKVSGFWTVMFVLSKLPELGDTVFIVLRKKPLIFLHWYHHITVLLYTWFSFTEYTSSARWFVVMNYCVHSVMYSYYALVSMGKYPPKFLAMTITFLQLTQMIVGCAVNIWAHNYMTTAAPHSCHISEINLKLSMAMYFSYFVLFARFFYKAYLSSKPGKKAKTEPLPEPPAAKKPDYNSYPRQRNGVVVH